MKVPKFAQLALPALKSFRSMQLIMAVVVMLMAVTGLISNIKRGEAERNMMNVMRKQEHALKAQQGALKAQQEVISRLLAQKGCGDDRAVAVAWK